MTAESDAHGRGAAAVTAHSGRQQRTYCRGHFTHALGEEEKTCLAFSLSLSRARARSLPRARSRSLPLPLALSRSLSRSLALSYMRLQHPDIWR